MNDYEYVKYKIIPKPNSESPVEERALNHEQLQHVYNFNMHVACSLSTLKADIYEMMRINSQSTALIIQEMRIRHGMNTQQVYHELGQIKKEEKERAIERANDWKWLRQWLDMDNQTFYD